MHHFWRKMIRNTEPRIKKGKERGINVLSGPETSIFHAIVCIINDSHREFPFPSSTRD